MLNCRRCRIKSILKYTFALGILAFLLHPGRFSEFYDMDYDHLELPVHNKLDLLPNPLGGKGEGFAWSLVSNSSQESVTGETADTVVIIPYRDRDDHLSHIIPVIKTIFQVQNIRGHIIVVEQFGMGNFNRGKLCNIGFVESVKIGNPGCAIFHDVDLIPTSTAIPYSCILSPRHMSTSLNVFRYLLPYREMVGGVLAVTVQHFHMSNGFSNNYFGWGGEDDDLYQRLLSVNLPPNRLSAEASRYIALPHKKQAPAPDRHKFTQKTDRLQEGLNTLTYQIVSTQSSSGVTRLVVQL